MGGGKSEAGTDDVAIGFRAAGAPPQATMKNKANPKRTICTCDSITILSSM
jgi:hypothetical protein